MDDVAVRIKKPRDSEYPAKFWFRKEFYAFPVQAVCDSKNRFTYMSVQGVGGTHDSLAFSVSSLAEHLRKEELLSGYWYAKDEASTCTENLLTPIPAGDAVNGSLEDAFNYSL